jgi:predicted transport protein
MATAQGKPRSMAQWAQVVRAAGITDYRQACKWLREEHGLTSNYAMMAGSIATLEGGFADYGDELKILDVMFAGPKEHLRPIFELLWDKAQQLGEDVELVVCKTQVSFRRNYQFAIVKPTNRTTMDISFALPPDTVAAGRLEHDPTRDADDRVQWRIRLTSAKDVNAEVLRYLNAAYACAAEKRKRN